MTTTVKTKAPRALPVPPSRPARRVGFHVSIAGSIPESIPRATAVGCTAMQIFTQSPRGGTPQPITPDVVRLFQERRMAADINPVAVHASYLINLASPERTTWSFACRKYAEELRRADALGADFLVTHVGSTKGKGAAFGIPRVAEAIAKVWAQVQPQRTMVLIENTAGSGQGLGSRFEEIRGMLDAIDDSVRVGVCVDTAHTFAAGYAIHTADGLRDTVQQIEDVIGWEHVRLIHLNDSKALFDSNTDRHWHIGQGHIGVKGFRGLVNHPRIAALPWILETPGETDADDIANLRTVLKLINP